MSFLQKLGSMMGSKTASITKNAHSKNPSSAIARERLSVILASQRGSELLAGVDMDALQKDVLEVVKRHIDVAQNSPVNCQVKNEGDVNLFEMSVEIDSCASRNGTNGNKSTMIRPATVTLHT
jgi:cell division topological specificity factor MinE